MKMVRKDTIFGNRHDRSTRRATKVLFLYFKYMFEILLEKKTFLIKGFGQLDIKKINVKRNNLLPTPRYYKGNTYLRNSKMMNPLMIGEVVFVSLTKQYNIKNKFRFQVCMSFRKKLTNLLYHTDYGKTLPLCQ
jgi:hypothetical protein